MYCAKCKEPIRDGVSTCPYCGATQPKFQPQQPPPQQYRQAPLPQYRQMPPPQQEYVLPKSYYTDSWLLFGLCMLFGLIRILISLSNSGEGLYKGLITCAAACVFIPQIKVDIKSSAGILIIKILVALDLIILL